MNRDGLIIRQLDSGPTVEAAIAAVAARRGPTVLDSAAAGGGREAGRYTILACEPVEVLSCPVGGGDPLGTLAARMDSGGKAERTARQRWKDARWSTGVPFVGGWIGFLGYEAGEWVEPTIRSVAAPPDDLSLPAARWGLYDGAAIHDAATGRWTVAAVDLTGLHARPGSLRSPEETVRAWMGLLEGSTAPPEASPPCPGPIEHNMSRAAYERMVERARAYIAAGDVYQVNLARRERFPVAEPVVATYLRLRRANPGAYAAFLSWREPVEQAILCSSPELFLRLEGREVVTRPIKGTRRRRPDPAGDEAMREELSRSSKDRAELAMIVDLERNDLGRVCEFGSMRVDSEPDSPAAPYALERHPTVHHLVATVRGTLRPDCAVLDLLRAVFPGGSITGAPKVRAMQIIRELEPSARSVYTGAIGFIGLDGSMCLNIAIRTLIMSGNSLYLYTGGGVVADSSPEAEYAETVAKAAGMRAAIGAEAGNDSCV